MFDTKYDKLLETIPQNNKEIRDLIDYVHILRHRNQIIAEDLKQAIKQLEDLRKKLKFYRSAKL